MTPHDFVRKWRGVELKERSASQTHFLDLCRLLGIDDPVAEDKTGATFTFEKGALKTSGGNGWADVWRKDCFAWEYKGRHANLDAALKQLLNYQHALDNPPLLIVSDMDVIRVHTNWTNSVHETHTLTLDDLLDGAKRDLLKACFTDPDRLKPAKTRQMLTEEAAQNFVAIAQRLRARGHEAHEVAHFVNRLVFCMFAEDVGLLPEKLFEKMIRASRREPDSFAENAGLLFRAMQTGGKVGYDQVAWFNGGLFDTGDTLPLTWEDMDDLIRATALDWSAIDPSIMGTLFERGLDPGKRSQLGAHYTDRDKIMMIVTPVIIEPLLAEWTEIRTRMQALLDAAPKQVQGVYYSPGPARPAHPRRERRDRAARRLPRPARRLPRPRPRLRLGQLPVPGAGVAEGHRPAGGAGGRGHGPPPPSRAARLRPREHAGHRTEPLRGRTRPRLGLDRRHPVEPHQRLRAGPQPGPEAPADHRMPGCAAECGRHAGRVAEGRRGGGEPSFPGHKATAQRTRRCRGERALRRLRSNGPATSGLGLLLVSQGLESDPVRQSRSRGTGFYQLHSWRGQPGGAEGNRS
jgi:hypothetical protein